jgi:hypothetical protein
MTPMRIKELSGRVEDADTGSYKHQAHQRETPEHFNGGKSSITDKILFCKTVSKFKISGGRVILKLTQSAN